ncbi:MAG: hypothetical protein D6698_04100 [Gammaproteobacteria bacterium]|nr:MAG: hypothetical protein D6698_04100 [Gammaproteobacteria bacterium]
MATYIIVDVNSVAHHAYHSFSSQHNQHSAIDLFDDVEDISRDEALYIDLTESIWFKIARYFKMFSADHAVLVSDSGSSWRKDIFEQYKSTRKLGRSEQKIKDMDLIHMVIDDFVEYAYRSTKMTSIYGIDKAEGDDIIARWCALHDMDGCHTIIISGDKDFQQLVSSQVSLFSPVKNQLFHDGRVFNYSYEPTLGSIDLYGSNWNVAVTDDGEPVEFDPGYVLFEKIIRGDPSDSIPSAYPRVRKKKLMEAYYGGDDVFNDLIHCTYMVGDTPVSVYDAFLRNQRLIDLKCLPDDLAHRIDEKIVSTVNRRTEKYPTIKLSQYAAMNNLLKIKDNISRFGLLVESEYF